MKGGFPRLKLPIKPPYEPMLARRREALPPGDTWLFEPKWDGFRLLSFRDGDQVVLQSKTGTPLTRYFPEIVEAFLKVKEKRFIVDGEIVIPVKGRLSFDDLLLRLHPAASRVQQLAREIPAQVFLFDLLVEGDEAVAELPLRTRRKRLERFVKRNVRQDGPIRLSPATTDRKVALNWFNNFGAAGLDGVMAKLIDEPYHSGDREAMIKVKHFREADCVVGGFRYSSTGVGIGSLLLGLYDEDGNLVFIGHTTSFNDRNRRELQKMLEPLRSDSAFSIRVPGGPSRWASERSGEWVSVEPTLVCEVQYDYYSQGRFRHGAKFLRWRPDKRPEDCTMDQVEPVKRRGFLSSLTERAQRAK